MATSTFKDSNGGVVFNQSLGERVSWAEMRYWTFQIASKGALLILYLSIIAEGLRISLAVLGKPLHKLPGCSALYNYEMTHKLDLAMIAAIMLLFVIWRAWKHILLRWTEWEPSQSSSADEVAFVRANRRNVLITIVGWVVILGEAGLFYSALAEMTWGSRGFSFTAAIGTAVYIAVLVFITHHGIEMRRELDELRRQYRNKYSEY